MPTSDRIAELEAKIEKLKAEKIDMLLHPEKYFSTYRDIKTVYKRAERLEAENAALKADPEKYFSIYRDIKTVFKRLERLEAENAALKAEFDHAVSVNNPCEHTGLESFVCDICGYPDPRKVIAALRAERDEWKDKYLKAGDVAAEWRDKLALMTAERDRLKAALLRIAAYGNDGICPYGCDTPDIARQALRGGEAPT